MSLITKFFRRSIMTFLHSAVIILMVCGTMYAESLFHKNGSISEGSVVNETDKTVTFKFANGKQKDVPREDVLRIVHHNDYVQKKYLYKTDNSMVEAFIVDEDQLTYTCRTDLYSAQEFIVSKSDIDTISKKKIGITTDTKNTVMTRKEKITTKASRVRAGCIFNGPFDTTRKYATMEIPLHGFFADIFIYRHRNTQGNGLDLMVRGTYNKFNDVTDPEYIGYPIQTGYTIEDSTIEQFALAAGPRFIYGWYAGGVLWQGYAFACYQYSSVNIEIYNMLNQNTGTTVADDMTSHGLTGGLGIEIAFSPYIGIFGEYTNGYSIAFPNNKNIESATFRFGATLRTSFL